MIRTLHSDILEQMKIDGIRAYEIEARVKRTEGGEPLYFKQVLAFQQFRYLLVHCSVTESAAEAYRSEFDQLITSIRFKKAR